MIRRSTLIVVGVFLALLVAVLLLRQNQPDPTAETTPTEAIRFLFDTTGNPIVRMRIEGSDGSAVHVEQTADGGWALLEPVAEPADPARVEAAVIQAESLRILADLEQQPPLGEIGLVPGVYRIEVEGQNGAIYTALIGNVTPTSSGYYAMVDGGEVVVVNQFSVDGVLDIFHVLPTLVTETPTTDPNASPTPEAGQTVTPEPTSGAGPTPEPSPTLSPTQTGSPEATSTP